MSIQLQINLVKKCLFFFALDNQLTGHGSLFSFKPMTFKILPYFLISPLVTRYSMGGSVRPVLPQIRPSKERLASRYSDQKL